MHNITHEMTHVARGKLPKKTTKQIIKKSNENNHSYKVNKTAIKLTNISCPKQADISIRSTKVQKISSKPGPTLCDCIMHTEHCRSHCAKLTGGFSLRCASNSFTSTSKSCVTWLDKQNRMKLVSYCIHKWCRQVVKLRWNIQCAAQGTVLLEVQVQSCLVHLTQVTVSVIAIPESISHIWQLGKIPRIISVTQL